MDSCLESISSLFSRANKYVVPSYQRLYSWDEIQWKDIWEDIFYHNPDQKYFFGTILLKESGTEGGCEILEVVDGQQRLTKMKVFFSEVIRRLKFLDKETDLSIKSKKYIQYQGMHSNPFSHILIFVMMLIHLLILLI